MIKDSSAAVKGNGVMERLRSIDYSKRIPYIYEYEKGEGFYLSKREKVVADSFLECRSIEGCRRACEVTGYPKPRAESIKKWLERGHVKKYLSRRFEELGITNGYTKESYVTELIKYKEGLKDVKPATLFCMKLLGIALGFNESQINVMNDNRVINFTQADGTV